MRSAIKMYRLKPVVEHDFAVELPKCMYKLTNVHERPKKVDDSERASSKKKPDILDQVKQFFKSCQNGPEMEEIQAKQADILEQLAQLKRQISTLNRELNVQTRLGSEKTLQSSLPKTKNFRLDTLVINANPSSPPYSLELVQRLLQNIVALNITSYVHSSIASLPESARKLDESLTNFKPPNGIPVVDLKLIWKNISSNSEFLLSHTAVSGEVNLLRYLSRAINTSLTYESDANAFEIDSLLDQCHLLARTKTKTERASIFNYLNKTLNKSPWLSGQNVASIVDVAAYSAIKQGSFSNELSANLTKWYQKCSQLVV